MLLIFKEVAFIPEFFVRYNLLNKNFSFYTELGITKIRSYTRYAKRKKKRIFI